jgi:ABC-2 type transport system ATP-binding protein
MEYSQDEIAIKVEKVSKTFKLPHEKQTSIKSSLINFHKHKRSHELQKVLSNISFEVGKGEFFGIVGRNGSGKSTLLKMLAGIYYPSAGAIQVEGRLTPFIELGVGFNMELTGRENVFLNGALLGFSRKEMNAMYKDIVAFAELERFMDQKLKNYSSGMQVRLAFSIAIRAQSDILLIDEVLAVGDAAFQQKCFDIFAELKKKGVTIVLVTHDMNSVLRFCDRAILIDAGKVLEEGEPALVAEAYLELNYEAQPVAERKESEGKDQHDKTNPRIKSVTIINDRAASASKFSPGDQIKVVVEYSNPKGEAMHFGLQVFNNSGVYCFGTNTKISDLPPITRKSGKITLSLMAELVPGSYYINAAAMNDNAATVFNYKSRAANFRIMKTTNFEGVALLEHTWSNDV